MKPCKVYEQELLLLAHGQLDASDAARIRKHISICPPCDERLSQLAGVSLLLADAVQFAPSTPTVPTAPRASFLPAKQQWLLSAFLGGCILFALLSLMRTAESYAAPLPGMGRIASFTSTPTPLACDTPPPCVPGDETAHSKVQRKQRTATTKSPKPVAPANRF